MIAQVLYEWNQESASFSPLSSTKFFSMNVMALVEFHIPVDYSRNGIFRDWSGLRPMFFDLF